MRALLTGASSFTGLWFARALVARGVEVIAPLRGALADYSGVRASRVRALQEIATIVPRVEFGSPEFFALFDRSNCDVVCHHAARVEGHRSPDFNVELALTENTRGLKALSERLRASATAGVILTGSVFEADEGSGTEPRRAFSPYGLSKTLTYSVVRFWCDLAGVPLGKFVIPNPFGPLEEPRFCNYLVKTWASGKTPVVHSPRYVRDHIPVSLLAKSYADFVVEFLTTRHSARRAPSFYTETLEEFAKRYACEMRRRIGAPCAVRINLQTDFSEPLVRINTDLADVVALGWDESKGWDEIAAHYEHLFRSSPASNSAQLLVDVGGLSG